MRTTHHYMECCSNNIAQVQSTRMLIRRRLDIINYFIRSISRWTSIYPRTRLFFSDKNLPDRYNSYDLLILVILNVHRRAKRFRVPSNWIYLERRLGSFDIPSLRSLKIRMYSGWRLRAADEKSKMKKENKNKSVYRNFRYPTNELGYSINEWTNEYNFAGPLERVSPRRGL